LVQHRETAPWNCKVKPLSSQAAPRHRAGHALAFARAGADIAFCHLHDDAEAEETAAEIRALGRRAVQRAHDVAEIAGSRGFAAWAAESLGPIDILFNNAGSNVRNPSRI